MFVAAPEEESYAYSHGGKYKPPNPTPCEGRQTVVDLENGRKRGDELRCNDEYDHLSKRMKKESGHDEIWGDASDGELAEMPQNNGVNVSTIPLIIIDDEFIHKLCVLAKEQMSRYVDARSDYERLGETLQNIQNLLRTRSTYLQYYLALKLLNLHTNNRELQETIDGLKPMRVQITGSVHQKLEFVLRVGENNILLDRESDDSFQERISIYNVCMALSQNREPVMAEMKVIPRVNKE
jgi:hypothetical protein